MAFAEFSGETPLPPMGDCDPSGTLFVLSKVSFYRLVLFLRMKSTTAQEHGFYERRQGRFRIGRRFSLKFDPDFSF